MPVTVRRCDYEDLMAVHELLLQLQEAVPTVEEPDLDTMQTIFSEMDLQPGLYMNLVAESEEKIIGFLSLVCYKTLYHGGGTALINELVIDRAHRGTGVGRLLIAAAEEAARAHGMDELEVATESANKGAQAFYRHCGFDQEYVLFGMEFS